MAIKPIDIRRKEFSTSFRGYDQNGVDDFLDTVADEFERTFTDNVRMRDEIQNLRERLQQFEDLEGSIRSALVHAEQAADDLRRSANREAETLRQSAKREAELTVKEAQNRAHQMLSDSSSRVERVQESYEALRGAKQTFAADFRHLLKSYLDVMDNADVATAKEIESSLRERLDTESIAVAREAHANEHDSGQDPLPGSPDDESTSTMITSEPEDEESDAPEDPDATQAFTRTESSEANGEPQQSYTPLADEDSDEPEMPESEPETSEPEYEPSSAQGTAEQEPVARDASTGESSAAEEVDREEPGLASRGSSNDFFGDEGQDQESDAGQGEAEVEDSPEQQPERQEDNRIFRASRFLRRRG